MGQVLLVSISVSCPSSVRIFFGLLSIRVFSVPSVAAHFPPTLSKNWSHPEKRENRGITGLIWVVKRGKACKRMKNFTLFHPPPRKVGPPSRAPRFPASGLPPPLGRKKINAG
jgi:hypothetical protein